MNLGIPGARPFFLSIFLSVVLAVFFAQLGVIALAFLTVPPQPRVFTVQEVGRALATGADNSRQLKVAIGEPPEPDDRVPSEQLRKALAEIVGNDHVRVRLDIPLLPFMRGPSAARSISQIGALFGRFEAAVQLRDGRWRVVTPADAGVDPWRQRMLLWIVAVMIVAAPTAWLLSRRLAAPIGLFVDAAERLGKDPRAPPIPVQGPAEVREASAIFNQMQDRLQRYVEGRTMMIAAIAHDLRTPMHRIRFKLDRLPEEDCRRIAGDIDEMNEMIDSVLIFVRDLQRERPRQKLELRSLIESGVNDFVDLGADVSFAPGPPLSIVADALGMKALIRNLVGNAIQYGERVRVTLARRGQAAEIVIEDDGPGIPADEIERVFEPFYRTEPSRSRETGGVGLGLATVQAVVSLHGGRVTLENRDECGLRATVSLPL